jgi:Endoplasmic Reticulum Oxidoreductin 1 (ERO1)
MATEESAVDRSLSVQDERALQALPGWKGLNNPWLPETDANVEFSYINLQVNPERYTGYTVRSSCAGDPDCNHESDMIEPRAFSYKV